MWYLFEYETQSYNTRDFIAKTISTEWGKLCKWNGNLPALTAFFAKIDKQQKISVSWTCFWAGQFSHNARSMRLGLNQGSKGERKHLPQPCRTLDWTQREGMHTPRRCSSDCCFPLIPGARPLQGPPFCHLLWILFWFSISFNRQEEIHREIHP